MTKRQIEKIKLLEEKMQGIYESLFDIEREIKMILNKGKQR